MVAVDANIADVAVIFEESEASTSVEFVFGAVVVAGDAVVAVVVKATVFVTFASLEFVGVSMVVAELVLFKEFAETDMVAFVTAMVDDNELLEAAESVSFVIEGVVVAA